MRVLLLRSAPRLRHGELSCTTLVVASSHVAEVNSLVLLSWPAPYYTGAVYATYKKQTALPFVFRSTARTGGGWSIDIDGLRVDEIDHLVLKAFKAFSEDY